MGVTPLTTVVTAVRHGADPHADVRFLDGLHGRRQIAELPDLVTVRGHPGNRRRIRSVTVHTGVLVLLAGANWWTQPAPDRCWRGECCQTARQVLETVDAAVVVLLPILRHRRARWTC